jgi:hypothetical protein
MVSIPSRMPSMTPQRGNSVHRAASARTSGRLTATLMEDLDRSIVLQPPRHPMVGPRVAAATASRDRPNAVRPLHHAGTMTRGHRCNRMTEDCRPSPPRTDGHRHRPHPLPAIPRHEICKFHQFANFPCWIKKNTPNSQTGLQIYKFDQFAVSAKVGCLTFMKKLILS